MNSLDLEPVNKFWFRRKRYGWGWYPASWKGWAAITVYIVLVVGDSYVPYLFGVEDSVSWKLTYLFAVTIIFLAFVWKTGESPRWQWGKKKE